MGQTTAVRDRLTMADVCENPIRALSSRRSAHIWLPYSLFGALARTISAPISHKALAPIAINSSESRPQPSLPLS